MLLSGIDYVVIGFYLVMTVAVGMWAMKFAGSTEDMLVAGRKLGIYSMMATLVATDWGAITMVYMGESGYTMGFSFLIMAWLFLFGYMVIAMPGIGTIWYRRMRIMTIPEVLEYRYGRLARAMAGITMVVAFLVVLGTFLQGVGAMFSTFFGVDPGITMLILLAVAMLYTVTGGMWSVVLTDLFQFLVLGIGLPLAAIFAIIYVGGWDAMFKGVLEARGASAVNPFLPDSVGIPTVIYQLIYVPFLTLAFPTTLIRVCATRSVREAHKGFALGTASFFSRVVFPALVGIAAIVAFPELEGVQAYSAMMVKALPPGMTGLLIGALMAGFMSTADSYYLAVGSMIPQDVVDPLLPKGRTLSSKQRVILVRLGVLLAAFAALYVGFFYRGGLLYWMIYLAQQMFVAGVGVSVLFGLYWSEANEYGAVAALILGCIGAAIPNYVLHYPEWLTGLISFGCSIAGMIIVSLASQSTCPPKKLIVRREARALANGLD